ncbi:cyclin-like protein [Haematococcus lacustris]
MAGHCPPKARAFMSERKTGRDLILSATRKKEGFSFHYYTAEEIENTPSRKDGVSAETEAGYRRNTRAFVQALSNLLKLQAWATQTAIGFCERFYMRRSFKANDRFLVAAAAIFMAAKALDGPRRAIDVAEAYYKTKCAKEPASWDEVKATKGLEIVSNIFTAERALLYTLGFDFQVDLPLNTTARVLAQFNNHVFAKLDKASEGESAGAAPDVEADSPDKLFAQLALNFANDSFKCSLPLQYPMHKIVAGGLAEAAERLNHKLPNPVDKGKEYSFLDYFCMTQAELDGTSMQAKQRPTTSS